MKKTKELTLIQSAVRDYMVSFRERYGRVPNAKDVADRFGFGERNASIHINSLERAGIIRRVPKSFEIS